MGRESRDGWVDCEEDDPVESDLARLFPGRAGCSRDPALLPRPTFMYVVFVILRFKYVRTVNVKQKNVSQSFIIKKPFFNNCIRELD